MSSASKEPKTQVNPLIDSLKALMNAKGYKLTEVQDLLLKHYLTTEKTKHNHYQRLYKLTSGELTELTDQEQQAITRFLDIETNPHRYGQAVHQAGNIQAKLREIQKAIYTGYHNPTNTKRILADLKHLEALQHTQ